MFKLTVWSTNVLMNTNCSVLHRHTLHRATYHQMLYPVSLHSYYLIIFPHSHSNSELSYKSLERCARAMQAEMVNSESKK